MSCLTQVLVLEAGEDHDGDEPIMDSRYAPSMAESFFPQVHRSTLRPLPTLFSQWQPSQPDSFRETEWAGRRF